MTHKASFISSGYKKVLRKKLFTIFFAPKHVLIDLLKWITGTFSEEIRKP